jgi:hypothetical protein
MLSGRKETGLHPPRRFVHALPVRLDRSLDCRATRKRDSGIGLPPIVRSFRRGQLHEKRCARPLLMLV